MYKLGAFKFDLNLLSIFNFVHTAYKAEMKCIF